MRYAVLTLSGSFRETGPLVKSLQNSVGGSDFRHDHFLIKTNKLIDMDKVDTVLISCAPSFSVGLGGGLNAVRRQILRLKKAGKRVVFYADNYNDDVLFLASVCDERLMSPIGFVSFLGRARTFLFAKKLLSKQKISFTVIRRGRFKSAGDRFRTDRLDDSNRLQWERFLQRSAHEIEEGMRNELGLDVDLLERLKAGETLAGDEAVEAGVVHRLVDFDAYKKELSDEKAKETSLSFRKPRYGRGKDIAVLNFEGAIGDENSSQRPLSGQIVGARDYLKHIRALEKDRKIKGVVLRVNSPGGSATGSEIIRAALERLAEKKPIAVSMSEVAGSGGYWISCLKAPVFAEPMTLTGSIGIIVLFASLRSFLRNLGITEDVIRTAPHADLGSPYRDLSKAEVQRIDDLIGKLYERFLNLVAEYREMTPGQVHERGEGRIYAGTEALEMGLISSLGGIDEAIESVRERLDAKRVRVRFYPRLKYSFAERILFSRRATAGPLSELASDVDTLFGLANAEPLAIVEDLFGSF